MFNNLTDKLNSAFKVLKGQGKITEINVAETLKEVRRALLEADVNFKTAKEFTQNVKKGGNSEGINLSSSFTVVLMSGLQGSGKTTFSGKLSNFLKNKKNKNPLLVACDVYRPAAIEQLKVLGDQLDIEVYSDENEKNPVKIETLFVVDSMTGQDAVNTAKAFNDILNFDGVILTKLDGDTRGGAALSIKSVVNKPIKFIGTGEKMDAIRMFMMKSKQGF